mmetsp:Transcript_4658/g.8252  ORF Transcript_4658/g.8252 Transcript_4658/m.8252 type:complete len:142 (+) Transcript_4658:1034-1459(+)
MKISWHGHISKDGVTTAAVVPSANVHATKGTRPETSGVSCDQMGNPVYLCYFMTQAMPAVASSHMAPDWVVDAERADGDSQGMSTCPSGQSSSVTRGSSIEGCGLLLPRVVHRDVHVWSIRGGGQPNPAVLTKDTPARRTL